MQLASLSITTIEREILLNVFKPKHEDNAEIKLNINLKQLELLKRLKIPKIPNDLPHRNAWKSGLSSNVAL